MRGSWVLSGYEAVETVRAAHERQDDFYEVILDWKMPGMDGLETLRPIRSQVSTKVPIIIISAYDYSHIEQEFIDAGANAFISKPLFKSKMLHALQLFCDSCKTENHAAADEKQYADLLGKRILLVEDNMLNREIAVDLLQLYGLIVEEAENGQVAVDSFSRSEPGYYDFILMDIQMPNMDGYKATEVIRDLADKSKANIPIIAMTANAFEEDRKKALAKGMNGHIAKPVDAEKVEKTICSVLGSQSEQ